MKVNDNILDWLMEEVTEMLCLPKCDPKDNIVEIFQVEITSKQYLFINSGDNRERVTYMPKDEV